MAKNDVRCLNFATFILKYILSYDPNRHDKRNPFETGVSVLSKYLSFIRGRLCFSTASI